MDQFPNCGLLSSPAAVPARLLSEDDHTAALPGLPAQPPPQSILFNDSDQPGQHRAQVSSLALCSHSLFPVDRALSLWHLPPAGLFPASLPCRLALFKPGAPRLGVLPSAPSALGCSFLGCPPTVPSLPGHLLLRLQRWILDPFSGGSSDVHEQSQPLTATPSLPRVVFLQCTSHHLT